MDTDDQIQVGDFIPDVGAEETVVSPDIGLFHFLSVQGCGRQF